VTNGNGNVAGYLGINREYDPDRPPQTPLMDDMQLISAEEVAGLMGVTAYTVRLWAREERIPHLRVAGSTLRFRSGAIRAWLAEQERGGKPRR
jgi:excisionase family DNA binding protein